MRSRFFAAFIGCLAGCFMLAAMIPAVSAAAKTVAVLPFTMNSPQDLTFLQNGLFSMLSSRLSDPGKVNVLDRATVDQALTDSQGDLTQAAAKNIGAGLGADYVLFGSLTHFGDSVSLDAAMVDITGDKPAMTFFEQSNSMGDVIPLVNTFAGDINQKVFNRSIANDLYVQPADQGPQAPGGFQSAGGQGGFINMQQPGGRGGFATHLSMDDVINTMAVGDLTDDGMLQVVAATDNTLMIHQMSDNYLVLEKQLEYSSNHRIVALDIADINGNGYPEIFVTSYTIHLDGLQSFVVEYNGSDYVTITDNQHYYYRVIDAPDGSQTLMGQRTGKSPFDGPVYIMQAEGSTYTRQKEVRLPRNTSVLSLAKGPVTNESADEYVMINRFGRLVVTDDGGSEQWESTAKYGGTPHAWLMQKNDPDGSYRERVYIHPRVRFYDMTDEEALEILAVQNNTFGGEALGRYKRFKNGTIQVMAWNGIALAPLFKTHELQGWISDFAVADLNQDGRNELVVSVVTQTQLEILGKDKASSIISYELE